MKLGAVNHIAICVSDLARSISFYQPVLQFLGYENTESFADLKIWESHSIGTAINLWQAKQEHIGSSHYDYAPGLHHLAFHATNRKQVDDFYHLLGEIGAEIVDAPAEYNYAPGYYAVFCRDPDGIRIELTYIPALSSSDETD